MGQIRTNRTNEILKGPPVRLLLTTAATTYLLYVLPCLTFCLTTPTLLYSTPTPTSSYARSHSCFTPKTRPLTYDTPNHKSAHYITPSKSSLPQKINFHNHIFHLHLFRDSKPDPRHHHRYHRSYLVITVTRY